MTRSDGPDGTRIEPILTTGGGGSIRTALNDALGHVAEVEAQLAPLASRRITRSDEPRHRLLTLGQDLPAVWNHPTAAEALKNVCGGRCCMRFARAPRAPEPLLRPLARRGAHGVAGGTAYRGKHGRATA